MFYNYIQINVDFKIKTSTTKYIILFDTTHNFLKISDRCVINKLIINP